MSSSEDYITLSGLTKSYGYNRVLGEINLNFSRGEFVTILGPNGAGKTTLIKILSTLIKPSAGDAEISGYDLKKDVSKIRGITGLLSHENFIYNDLTVYENLIFFAEMFNVWDKADSVKKIIQRLGIEKKRGELIRNLSSGMKQRVSIARALIHDPVILLLDEPFVGLDIDGVSILIDILKEAKEEEKTVIMSTHDMQNGNFLADRVVILNEGEVIYNKYSSEIDMDGFESDYKKILNI